MAAINSMPQPPLPSPPAHRHAPPMRPHFTAATSAAPKGCTWQCKLTAKGGVVLGFKDQLGCLFVGFGSNKVAARLRLGLAPAEGAFGFAYNRQRVRLVVKMTTRVRLDLGALAYR
nr:hypothetical protein [Tanacetum cinerariifolium]